MFIPRIARVVMVTSVMVPTITIVRDSSKLGEYLGEVNAHFVQETVQTE